jgi:hypothetical protein
MELRPSQEAASGAAAQDVPNISRNPKVHDRVRNIALS